MRYLGAVIAFLLVDVSPALAATHFSEGSWVDFRYRTISFVLFALILTWLLAKRIANYYRQRKQQIIDGLAELEEAKKNAEVRLKEVEEQIAHLKEEGEAILNEYRQQGENIQKAIIARAETSARHITEQAQLALENEAKMAAENLRNDVADMVIDAAEQMFKDRLSSEEQEKLIDKYLNRVVLN